jgi:hypothetical protein
MIEDGADHVWTGYHTFNKQAARELPSVVTRSLQGGIDIRDSAILLASNYVAAHDVRKTTDVAIEAPVSASWGGNFAAYLQHKVAGVCGPNGTLTGVIRAQLETTQAKNGAPINDASAVYAGIYNNGVDVGGFGMHVDAYHAGVAERGHSTYGFSSECWKEAAGGVMAAYVARSQGAQKLDYGLAVVHSGPGTLGRGIALGNPGYGGGGVQGAPGVPTTFDVGVDLTWGSYRTGAALMLKADDFLVLSGQPQAQAAPVVAACQMRFDSQTGMFAVRNGPANRFDVNMTTGTIWQNGNPTWSGFDGNPWAFSVGPGKTTPHRPGATPVGDLHIRINGEEFVVPFYRPAP